jgi:predicted nucleotidyltransferase
MEKRNKTMMRIDRSLLDEIKKRKIINEESYQSVIKRMIDRETNGSKNSYNTRDPFDMPMILDNPETLNKKGLKKRLNWQRRGLL